MGCFFMGLTIIGRSIKDVKKVLDLLGDLNAYKIEKGDDPFFDPDQLAAAPNMILEEDGLCKVAVECLDKNQLNGGIIHDALFYENIIPNPFRGDIYASEKDAKEIIGKNNRVDEAVRAFSDKIQTKRVHPELGSFLAYQNSRLNGPNFFVHEPC